MESCWSCHSYLTGQCKIEAPICEPTLSEAYPSQPEVDVNIVCWVCDTKWTWVQHTREECPECGVLDTPF